MEGAYDIHNWLMVEQSLTLEATSSWCSPEISHVLWNPKVRHNIEKNPQLCPLLSQGKQVHALPSYAFKILFNIILLSVHVVTCSGLDGLGFEPQWGQEIFSIPQQTGTGTYPSLP